MTEELKQACFEIALTTEWARKPVDAAEIQAVADKLYEIAKQQVSPELDIDIPLITRAVRYLGQVHAIHRLDELRPWNWRKPMPSRAEAA